MKNDGIIMKPVDKEDGIVIWNKKIPWENGQTSLMMKKFFKHPKKIQLKLQAIKHFDKDFLSIYILIFYSLVEFIYFPTFTKG